MSTDNRPIGIFDSGLGGLTVARAVAAALPHESIVYVGDTQRCPYGTRSEDEVRSFVRQVGEWLARQDVKVMVIACNTATAAGLALAQQTFDVPVIGVIVPGARAAIHSTRSRKVGVLATELTVRSGAYTRAIQDFDAGVEVYGCPASCFVELVEGELAAGQHDSTRCFPARCLRFARGSRARGYHLAPLKGHGIDTVVLGCTHFPLLVGAYSRGAGGLRCGWCLRLRRSRASLPRCSSGAVSWQMRTPCPRTVSPPRRPTLKGLPARGGSSSGAIWARCATSRSRSWSIWANMI